VGTTPITLELTAFQPAPATQQVAAAEPEPAEPVAAPAPQDPMPPDPPPQPVAAQPEVIPPSVPEPVRPPEPRVVKPPTAKPSVIAHPVATPKPPPPRRAPSVSPPVAARPPVEQPNVAKAAPPGPVAPLVDGQAAQQYLTALAAQINRSKFYPRASRRLHEQGTVVVSFVILRSGELTELSIAESSGYARLDDAALETLRRLSPFTQIPAAIGRDQWPISVPLAFHLRP
jgi:protein TonB